MSIACSTCIMLASLFFLLNNVIFQYKKESAVFSTSPAYSALWVTGPLRKALHTV